MSEFKFEFPKSLPQEHLEVIEKICFRWVKTFKIKNEFSKEERIAKYKEIVKRDVKDKLGESEDITNALINALDFYEKRITE